MKFCKVSENPKSIICWKFQLSISLGNKKFSSTLRWFIVNIWQLPTNNWHLWTKFCHFKLCGRGGGQIISTILLLAPPNYLTFRRSCFIAILWCPMTIEDLISWMTQFLPRLPARQSNVSKQMFLSQTSLMLSSMAGV